MFRVFILLHSYFYHEISGKQPRSRSCTSSKGRRQRGTTTSFLLRFTSFFFQKEEMMLAHTAGHSPRAPTCLAPLGWETCPHRSGPVPRRPVKPSDRLREGPQGRPLDLLAQALFSVTAGRSLLLELHDTHLSNGSKDVILPFLLSMGGVGGRKSPSQLLSISCCSKRGPTPGALAPFSALLYEQAGVVSAHPTPATQAPPRGRSRKAARRLAAEQSWLRRRASSCGLGTY